MIKTKLGQQVGHIMSNGDPVPLPKRSTAPHAIFGPCLLSVLGCLFVVFFIIPFVFFSSVRQIKTAFGGKYINIVYRIVSYRIVSYHAVFATK